MNGNEPQGPFTEARVLFPLGVTFFITVVYTILPDLTENRIRDEKPYVTSETSGPVMYSSE